MLALGLALNSCRSAPPDPEASFEAPATPAVPSESPTAQSPAASTTPTATGSARAITGDTGKTRPVTLYVADNQCQKLVPKQAEVSAKTPIQAAVGEVIQTQSSAGFDLAGYRVNVNKAARTATVDLRLTSGAKRTFESLSSCEQFALFGAIQKTLTANPDWNIAQVRFTTQGKQIEL
ncbi:GerMN domain-containing protein [Leptolyngbya sp. FACHB-261]|nr:GerMN domain-containing protein [Leptolyngbya sp. FACHB-261]